MIKAKDMGRWMQILPISLGATLWIIPTEVVAMLETNKKQGQTTIMNGFDLTRRRDQSCS